MCKIYIPVCDADLEMAETGVRWQLAWDLLTGAWEDLVQENTEEKKKEMNNREGNEENRKEGQE